MAESVDALVSNTSGFTSMESVDALVSNTSGFTSIPVRPRVWVQITAVNHLIFSRFYFVEYKQGINKQQQPYLAALIIEPHPLFSHKKI